MLWSCLSDIGAPLKPEEDSEPSDVLVLTVETDEEDEFFDAEDGTAVTVL